jgi:hypothetical protein
VKEGKDQRLANELNLIAEAAEEGSQYRRIKRLVAYIHSLDNKDEFRTRDGYLDTSSMSKRTS